MGPEKSITRIPKSKAVAIVLALFLGMLGIHAFYLNRSGIGLLLLMSFLIGLVFPPLLLLNIIVLFCDFISICFIGAAEWDREYYREITTTTRTITTT